MAAPAPTRRGRRAACNVGNLPYRRRRALPQGLLLQLRAPSAPRSIAVDRETGRSRGFGFVSFQDSKSASDAIKGMNGQDIGGRNVIVQEAQPRSRR
ncbi:hypothetical protein OsJ_17597 [Oryza sativa Japonica Group]|uniref:RRM domain-containing protein n=1 Tax=Oryza sativa subsp. japonica TaxID=39947 RepID=B9FJ39_ORYSJ|nr:hypothetical protein OsJ_17597 [Oryza sativa Japonica Group]